MLLFCVSTVHFAAQRHGTAVSGPGPPLPPLLLLLALLPAAQERRLLALPFALAAAAQRRLLLHRLVRHHRHARLQVRHPGSRTSFDSTGL